MQRRRFVLTATAALATPSIVRAQKASVRLTTLARDLEQPWSIAFLPDGRLLITERPGRLRVFANGKLERTPLAEAHFGPALNLLADAAISHP